MLLFADMDGLKTINDTFGHAEGDRALAETASLLQSLLRESDIVARVGGGDEFAALMCDTSSENAGIAVERVSALFAERNEERTTPWELNLSVGAVTVPPDSERSLAEIIAEADQRMYSVKLQRRALRL